MLAVMFIAMLISQYGISDSDSSQIKEPRGNEFSPSTTELVPLEIQSNDQRLQTLIAEETTSLSSNPNFSNFIFSSSSLLKMNFRNTEDNKNLTSDVMTSPNPNLSTEDYLQEYVTNEQNHTSKNHNKDSTKKRYLAQIYVKLKYIQNLYMMPPLCSLGIIGSSLVAYCVILKKTFSSTNTYIVACMLAHILSLVFDLSAAVTSFSTTSNTYISTEIKYLCGILLNNICRNTALNILCVMSVERMVAIRYPLKLKMTTIVRRPGCFVSLAVLIGILGHFTSLLYVHTIPVINPKTNKTTYKRQNTEFYLQNKGVHDMIILSMKLLSGPLQIAFFCVINCLIIHSIHINRNKLKTLTATATSRRQQMRKLQIKLCKIFFALCIANVLAFLPNAFTTIIGRIFPELGLNIGSPTLQLWAHGGNILKTLNSACDFILLLIMSRELRCSVKQCIISICQ